MRDDIHRPGNLPHIKYIGCPSTSCMKEPNVMHKHILLNANVPIMERIHWHKVRWVGTELGVVCILECMSSSVKMRGSHSTLIGINNPHFRISVRATLSLCEFASEAMSTLGCRRLTYPRVSSGLPFLPNKPRALVAKRRGGRT